MDTYSFRESPLRVYGAPLFYETGSLHRLPRELAQKMHSSVISWKLDVRCPGARVAFKTDAEEFEVRVELEPLRFDPGMALWAAQSSCVFTGRGESMRYAGLAVPPEGYKQPCAVGKFRKSSALEDVLIYLPRNEEVKEVYVSVPDGARVEAPTPYRYETPVVFYGSSITEGGCASKVSNAYNALMCRRLDCDFINLGFSGCALGELCVADYINSLDKSVFVLDYDHNAPTPEHLERTHEPFFLRVREHSPDLPIIIVGGPYLYLEDENVKKRREILRRTYENALARGDKHVWYIDSAELLGSEDREACTADCVHPNDLGMYRMSERIQPVLEEALKDFEALRG